MGNKINYLKIFKILGGVIGLWAENAYAFGTRVNDADEKLRNHTKCYVRLQSLDNGENCSKGNNQANTQIDWFKDPVACGTSKGTGGFTFDLTGANPTESCTKKDPANPGKWIIIQRTIGQELLRRNPPTTQQP